MINKEQILEEKICILTKNYVLKVMRLADKHPSKINLLFNFRNELLEKLEDFLPYNIKVIVHTNSNTSRPRSVFGKGTKKFSLQ